MLPRFKLPYYMPLDDRVSVSFTSELSLREVSLTFPLRIKFSGSVERLIGQGEEYLTSLCFKLKYDQAARHILVYLQVFIFF